MCDCDCELPKRERWAQVEKGVRDRIADVLEGLRSERSRPHEQPSRDVLERQRGEINGLDMSIRIVRGGTK